MNVRYFVYCSRCRKPVDLTLAVPCPQTDRWMHERCSGVKVRE